MTSEKPTVDERYSTALESSHLEVLADHRGDADYLIAAGLARSRLGTALFRLRSEWDAARGEWRHGAAHILALLDEARSCDRAGALEAAFRLRLEAEQEAVTHMALTLIQLKTLASAKAALLSYALRQATLRRFMRPDEDVAKIAGRALEAWLDPTCMHCDGRGFNGGFDAPRALCTHCGGTDRRPIRLGPSNSDHEFGRFLLAQMDAKTEWVARRMRRLLSAR